MTANRQRGTRLINVNTRECVVAEDVSGQDDSLQKSHKKNASKHPKHRGGTIWLLFLLASEKLEWSWAGRADLTEDLLNAQIKGHE